MSSQRFLVWGAGGHGKVVGDLLRANRHTVVGYLDRDPAKLDVMIDGAGGKVVLSEENFLLELREGNNPSLRASAIALGIGDNTRRLECADVLRELCAPAVIHPLAAVSPTTALSRGSVVFAGAVINSGARIGTAVIVNSGAIVEHDCDLGDGAHVSPGAILAGGVRVRRKAWIGAGAIVLPGINVGEEAIVGAGAVVTRDVPPHVTILGNPARPLDRT